MLSYKESFLRAQDMGLLLDSFGSPEVYPTRPPSKDEEGDDQCEGAVIFRTELENEDCTGWTLPFSLINYVAFKNVRFDQCELSSSAMGYVSFEKCRFVEAKLVAADLQDCVFTDVDFRGADLSFADLRGSKFLRCQFDGACLKGAMLTRTLIQRPKLSSAQRAEAKWFWTSPGSQWH